MSPLFPAQGQLKFEFEPAGLPGQVLSVGDVLVLSVGDVLVLSVGDVLVLPVGARWRAYGGRAPPRGDRVRRRIPCPSSPR